MRKRLLISAAAVAATLVALLLPMSSASADGNTTINIGPGQYTFGFTHPTGTISIGGGTVSARCTAQAVKGSAFYQTPGCATRAITCPTTAAYCSLVWNGRESALRGPVEVNGLIFSTGGFTSVSYISPYNCPQFFSCGARLALTVPAGSVIQAGLENIVYNPSYPNVFNQVTLTVH